VTNSEATLRLATVHYCKLYR